MPPPPNRLHSTAAHRAAVGRGSVRPAHHTANSPWPAAAAGSACAANAAWPANAAGPACAANPSGTANPSGAADAAGTTRTADPAGSADAANAADSTGTARATDAARPPGSAGAARTIGADSRLAAHAGPIVPGRPPRLYAVADVDVVADIDVAVIDAATIARIAGPGRRIDRAGSPIPVVVVPQRTDRYAGPEAQKRRDAGIGLVDRGRIIGRDIDGRRIRRRLRGQR